MKKRRTRPTLRELRAQCIAEQEFPQQIEMHFRRKRVSTIAGWQRRHIGWFVVETPRPWKWSEIGAFVRHLTEIQEWMMENLHFQYQMITSDCYGFSDLSDATYFKLRFR